ACVVEWVTNSMASGPCPVSISPAAIWRTTSTTPAATPSAWEWVVGTTARATTRASPSRATALVNVPPTSTPTRRPMIRSAPAAALVALRRFRVERGRVGGGLARRRRDGGLPGGRLPRRLAQDEHVEGAGHIDGGQHRLAQDRLQAGPVAE